MLEVVNGGWEVQEQFNNPEDLIRRAHDVIRANREYITNYRDLNMNYPEFITINLEGVYENGIVYNIFCHVDAAAEHYNTMTSAKLIVRRDGTVKFIIEGVDCRVNKSEKSKEAPYLLGRVNQNKLEEEMKKLGKRIDLPLIDKKSNVFNRRHKEKVRELTKQKVQVLIYESIMHLESVFEDKKTK